jgi:hypothetical protein
MGDLDSFFFGGGGGGGLETGLRVFGSSNAYQRKSKMRTEVSCQSNRLLILLLQAETQIRILMSHNIFKMKINTYHQSPRLIPTTRHHLDPLYFSLQTTFNLRYV